MKAINKADLLAKFDKMIYELNAAGENSIRFKDIYLLIESMATFEKNGVYEVTISESKTWTLDVKADNQHDAETIAKEIIRKDNKKPSSRHEEVKVKLK